MELNLQLKALADKINQMKDQIDTEEGTKTAFVLPFINLLGYDIFNPMEVTPEFTADLGLKKGEKVDYAIYQNGTPILIIECKCWKEDLNVHNSQLFRYFHVTKTRFSLLTNGIDYRFYSDLEAPNKMDEKPFLEFNMTSLKESTINEIAKFHKSNFDVDKIINNASALKYIAEIKKIIAGELANPTTELVRHYANQVYNGRLTEKVLEQFKDFVSKALNQHISERVNDRLTAALSKENEKQVEQTPTPAEEEVSKVETTQEELEAYQIVVAILRRILPKDRIAHRDTQSYFGILLDDNNRKPICRLHLNASKKYISLFHQNKAEQKEQIQTIDDIYRFENELLQTVRNYEDN
jgi:predicted type IV restriction endonuclease